MDGYLNNIKKNLNDYGMMQNKKSVILEFLDNLIVGNAE